MTHPHAVRSLLLVNVCLAAAKGPCERPQDLGKAALPPSTPKQGCCLALDACLTSILLPCSPKWDLHGWEAAARGALRFSIAPQKAWAGPTLYTEILGDTFLCSCWSHPSLLGTTVHWTGHGDKNQLIFKGQNPAFSPGTGWAWQGHSPSMEVTWAPTGFGGAVSAWRPQIRLVLIQELQLLRHADRAQSILSSLPSWLTSSLSLCSRLLL